ncbi:RNA ligase [uncultured archaeon]|nr:RNA ligase [uncultured archaeon]
MKNASIETIIDIQPIPNSDNIELAKVLGWQSVVKNNEYKIGDNVIFVPIDTVLPDTDWSAFLKDKKDPTKPIILRTVKMRGVISQGVIFPISILPATLIRGIEIGEDVSSVLGITHFEKPLPVNADAIGTFPSVYVSITDEDNLNSNPDVLAELQNCDDILEITLKMDGTSFTSITPIGEPTQICSRRLSLKDSDNLYWSYARKYNLLNFDGYAFQGELCGGNINGNNMGLQGHELYIFNIKDLRTVRRLTSQELTRFCIDKSLVKVPVIAHIHSTDLVSLAKLQEIANNVKYDNGKPAEGIVIRPYTKNVKSAILLKDLSVKVINQNYKG